MQSTHQPVTYQRYTPSGFEPVSAEVIAEVPLTLTINGQVWLEFLCTPTYLEALAVGFLFNEGLISSAADLASVHLCAEGDNVDVWTRHPLAKPPVWRRTSGCGGGSTSHLSPAPAASPKPENSGYAQTAGVPAPDFSIAASALLELMRQLMASQELYHRTRGVHSSAVSDGAALFLQVEDIGRHNTLDKIAGRLLLEAPPLRPRILLTTGRVSSEMLQKAQRIGVSTVVSRTSPTSLSVRMAEEAGITLVGYARKDQFIVYAHPYRILTELET